MPFNLMTSTYSTVASSNVKNNMFLVGYTVFWYQHFGHDAPVFSGHLLPEKDQNITVKTAAGFLSTFRLVPESCVSYLLQPAEKPPTSCNTYVPLLQYHIHPRLEVCLQCDLFSHQEEILVCCRCCAAYHTFCLDPPWEHPPTNDWRCTKCLSEEYNRPSEVYGFEQAKKEYSLREYARMANDFKEEYFSLALGVREGIEKLGRSI